MLFKSKLESFIKINDDNLLEKAGCTDVVHLHGKVGYLQCTAGNNVFESEIDVTTRCSKCDSLKGSNHLW